MKGCSQRVRPYHWWMLNERLKSLRLAKGLTLQQVGDFFGISKVSISSWETGKSNPDHKKLEKLSELFGTSVQYLVTGTNDDNSTNPKTPNIPFCDWDQIGKKSSTSLIRKILPLHTKPGKNSFATRYPASKDINWQASYIPAGSILIVDPDEVPGPLDTVIVKIEGSTALAKFVQTPENKKVLVRADFVEIKEIPKNSFTLIGVVLEWQISAKLK